MDQPMTYPKYAEISKNGEDSFNEEEYKKMNIAASHMDKETEREERNGFIMKVFGIISL